MMSNELIYNEVIKYHNDAPGYSKIIYYTDSEGLMQIDLSIRSDDGRLIKTISYEDGEAVFDTTYHSNGNPMSHTRIVRHDNYSESIITLYTEDGIPITTRSVKR